MPAPPSPPGLLDFAESLGGNDDWRYPHDLYQHFYAEPPERSILDPGPPEGSHSTVVGSSINKNVKQTSFCGVSRDGHDLDRRDAFYMPSPTMPPGTIFVGIWSETRSLGQQSPTAYGEHDKSEHAANFTGKTLFVYSRICFPIPKSTVGKLDLSMWPRATRDFAAKAIDARLDSLQSRHALSMTLASASPKNILNITKSDPTYFSQGLNTMLQDTRFTFDGQPDTTFALKKNAPEVSTRCQVTVDGGDHLITFRKGLTTADCWDLNKLPNFDQWSDGEMCDLGSIVNKSSNNSKLFPDTTARIITDVSVASEAPQPPKDLDNCVMGNAILWRAKVDGDAAESTSGPAN